LVRVPSVSGDECAVQGIVEDALLGCGLAVERCEATAALVAPYAEHVGEETRFEGHPNIIGARTGSAGAARCF